MNSPTLKDNPELAELQRLADIGRLSATLLHEISNPLSSAMIRLDDIKHNHRCVRLVKKDIIRLNRYLEAARGQIYSQGENKSFSLASQLVQVRRITQPLAKRSVVRLIYEPIPRLRLSGDPVKFQQIMVNLILNAIEAYDGLATNQTRAVLVSFKQSKDQLSISVTDWGKGIARTELPHLFDPFYTTKQAKRRGLGIGLTIVKDYISHGFSGSVSVESSPKLGTCFSLQIKL